MRAWGQPIRNFWGEISITADAGLTALIVNGQTSMTAQSGQNALLVSGAASNFTSVITGSSSSGNSLGELVNAGTTSADTCAAWFNQPGTTQYMKLFGDGGLVVGPSSLADEGPGSINAGTMFISGSPLYVGSPPNANPGTSYQFVLSDQGKTISRTGGAAATYIIPANATVPLPNGTLINVTGFPGVTGVTTISPAAGVTLLFLPGGSSGSRTGATTGFVATLYQAFANTWYIWGAGVT
jgi:hypothetical protein